MLWELGLNPALLIGLRLAARLGYRVASAGAAHGKYHGYTYPEYGPCFHSFTHCSKIVLSFDSIKWRGRKVSWLSASIALVPWIN